MKPKDLPSIDCYSHGTRARYVAGCRCDECKGANRKAYHERQRQAKELAAQITTSAAPAPQVWTTPSGKQKVRIYKRACPGVNEEPCERRSHLRKDSKGGVCGKCRLKLAWNGLVDTKRARRHILKLSRQGVGYKMVADAAGVATSIVGKIRSGKRKNIRASTERKILEIDIGAMADKSYVPAAPTWMLINELLKKGYTKTELAQRMGSKAKVPALQLKSDHITLKNAHKVKKLYDEVMEEIRLDSRYKPICTNCARYHTKKARLEFLRRRLPASSLEIKEAWSCAYGSLAGDRALYRDLQALGAWADSGIWRR